jgi:hypothetical protein
MLFNDQAFFRSGFSTPFSGRTRYFRPLKHRQHKPRPMRGLFNLLTFLFTTGFFIIGIFYFAAKVLGRIIFDPASQAWKRTLERLQTRIRSQAAGALIPWDAEMLSLLSLNRTKVKKPGWMDSTSEGVFTSIYQEPILAYAGQVRNNTAVYVARTSDKEYIFRQKEKETEIWINNQPFAVYINGILLAAGRSSQVLARLEADMTEAQWSVLIQDKAAAAITNPQRAASAGPNPRALTMLRKVSAEEEDALLALTLLFALKS